MIDSICVVDNNSNDNFDTDFDKNKIKYIKNKENKGYSDGNNVGLKYLVNTEKCDICFIANPDVIFEENTLKEIIDAMEKNEKIVVASSRRYGPNNAIIHQYFDFPDIKTSIKNCFYFPRKKFEKNRHIVQNDKVNNTKNNLIVDAVPGSFFAIKSSFLKKNDFLYDGIFMYGEEIILGRQVSNAGYCSAIVTSVSYIHNHKQERFSNKKMFKMDRESLKIYYKMFEKYKWYQILLLNIACFIGNLEYSCAFYIYHIVKHERKK